MLSTQGHAFNGHMPTLDQADRLWRGLCVEREAAREHVIACVRATESGSLEAFSRLKQARHRAKLVQHVMLRFLDVLDGAH